MIIQCGLQRQKLILSKGLTKDSQTEPGEWWGNPIIWVLSLLEYILHIPYAFLKLLCVCEHVYVICAYMYLCSWVGACMHMPWECSWRSENTTLGTSLCLEQRLLSSTARALHRLAGPWASWGSPPVSTFHLALEVLALWMLPHQPYIGFWGSKLRGSCLHS